jgi:hypothetical protein
MLRANYASRSKRDDMTHAVHAASPQGESDTDVETGRTKAMEPKARDNNLGWASRRTQVGAHKRERKADISGRWK